MSALFPPHEVCLRAVRAALGDQLGEARRVAQRVGVAEQVQLFGSRSFRPKLLRTRPKKTLFRHIVVTTCPYGFTAFCHKISKPLKVLKQLSEMPTHNASRPHPSPRRRRSERSADDLRQRRYVAGSELSVRPDPSSRWVTRRSNSRRRRSCPGRIASCTSSGRRASRRTRRWSRRRPSARPSTTARVSRRSVRSKISACRPNLGPTPAARSRSSRPSHRRATLRTRPRVLRRPQPRLTHFRSRVSQHPTPDDVCSL